MDENVKRAKKLLESKGYNVSKMYDTSLFDIDESDVIPLKEFVDIHGNEYGWEETLEESLYDYEDDEILDESISDKDKEFRAGDIIMTPNYYSSSSHKKMKEDPHRILVITSKKVQQGNIEYTGFLLSSRVEKANIEGKYPNNIYIKNYSTILSSGAPANKPAFIRVDDIVKFTNKDLSHHGSKKGVASKEFIDFIELCYNNYKSGNSKLNFDMKWD